MAAPWDIYTNELLKTYACYGFPLWNPRPDLGNVSIGDVGRIEDGQFDCLFNTITRASRWADELPDSFEWLPRDKIDRLRKPQVINSSSLSSRSFRGVKLDGQILGAGHASAGVSFKCTENRGAVLHLPTNRATGAKITKNNFISNYVRRNLKDWLTFAAEVANWDVREEDLIFVSGYLKTQMWAVAACIDHGRNATLSIRADPVGASFHMSFSAGLAPVIHTDYEPQRGATATERSPEADQCIFLSVYKGKHRRGGFAASLLSRIKAAAESAETSRSWDDDDMDGAVGSRVFHVTDESEEGIDVGPYPRMTHFPDPLTQLLDRLLHLSSADAAIVSTDDLHYLLRHTMAGNRHLSYEEVLNLLSYSDDVVVNNMNNANVATLAFDSSQGQSRSGFPKESNNAETMTPIFQDKSSSIADGKGVSQPLENNSASAMNSPTSEQTDSDMLAPDRQQTSNIKATDQKEQEDILPYPDIFSHPAVLKYTTANPKGAIPKFGPYLVLHTLGEGEFWKLKLGVHMRTGEEVTVKLIRREIIDSSVRMSRVEREIEFLKTLKHPNIVNLCDVVESDKYVGIVLDYASGGELFDRILRHGHLREKTARELFSQLISAVWYMHQHQIVHRDLRLENLLLDNHGNVIISGFGSANRFEHQPDDLIQMTRGSPSYMAPELIKSDGTYVGPAVDIWSCGIILYAMLAGHLPFDDQEANPDGENIDLFYKHIMKTPLSFPDTISPDARDLLAIMLIPDPSYRADLPTLMGHRWLTLDAHNLNRSIADLERAAIEQHRRKRLSYQRHQPQTPSQSSRTDGYSDSASIVDLDRTRSSRNLQALSTSSYETSQRASVYSTVPNRQSISSMVTLQTPTLAVAEDVAVPSLSPSRTAPVNLTAIHKALYARETIGNEAGDIGMSPGRVSSSHTSSENERQRRMRHTIQIEYGGSEATTHRQSTRKTEESLIGLPKEEPQETSPADNARSDVADAPPGLPRIHSEPPPQLPVPARDAISPPLSIEVPAPSISPGPPPYQEAPPAAAKMSAKESRRRKGLSLNNIDFSKLLGTSSEQPTEDVQQSQSGAPLNEVVSTLQVPPLSLPTASPVAAQQIASPGESMNTAKKVKRRSFPKLRTKHSTSVKGKAVEKQSPSSADMQLSRPDAPKSPVLVAEAKSGIVPASTAKASIVMQWFRSKSKGKLADEQQPSSGKLRKEKLRMRATLLGKTRAGAI